MTRGSKKRSKLTLAKCISFLNIHTVEFSKKNTGSSIFDTPPKNICRKEFGCCKLSMSLVEMKITN